MIPKYTMILTDADSFCKLLSNANSTPTMTLKKHAWLQIRNMKLGFGRTFHENSCTGQYKPIVNSVTVKEETRAKLKKI